jgi:hypothetical protein
MPIRTGPIRAAATIHRATVSAAIFPAAGGALVPWVALALSADGGGFPPAEQAATTSDPTVNIVRRRTIRTLLE